MRVGIIGVQGSADEHIAIVKKAGADAFKIRKAVQLKEADAIIIPGGESTAIYKLFEENSRDSNFFQEFLEKARSVPVMGTCAGLILLSKEITDARVENFSVEGLKLLDIAVRRNYYGRQKNSFESRVRVTFLNSDFPGVFIRAPHIDKIYSGEPIAFLDDEPVGVRNKHVIGLAFHPELTDDIRIHQYFVSLAKR